MNRGDAAAGTWILCGDASRRRRGWDVDIPWRPARASGTADEGQLAHLVAACAARDARSAPAAERLRIIALEDGAKRIIAGLGGIRPLIELVRDGADDDRMAGREAAARTLWNLATNDELKLSIGTAGAVGPLARRPERDKQRREVAPPPRRRVAAPPRREVAAPPRRRRRRGAVTRPEGLRGAAAARGRRRDRESRRSRSAATRPRGRRRARPRRAVYVI